MDYVSAVEARQRFGEMLDRARFGRRVTIERSGRPVAVLVSFEEWQGVQERAGAGLLAMQARQPDVLDDEEVTAIALSETLAVRRRRR